MDIKALVSSTTLYNLHSHTQYCDGRATMETMARAAIDAGIIHWGFSPHSPIDIASSCNMDKDKIAEYITEVNRLRQLLGDKISLYASMEIDFTSKSWGPAIELFQSLPLDYRIGSVHFVPTRDGELIDCDGNFERFRVNMHTKFNDDIRYVVETFYVQSIKMVEAGGFDIIGHPDKIAHNASQFSPDIENEPWYIALSDNLIDAITSAGIIAEINTKNLPVYGRIFPSLRLIDRLIKKGVTLVVNSDAHYPEKVNYGRDKAFAIIDAITNNKISQLSC